MTELKNFTDLQKRLGGRNLYLVGMMGSGKSSTGPLLAKELAYCFVDSDKVIEEVCGNSISKIFKNDGEENFRTVETQVLSAIGERHSLVVATGGGIVTRSENWGVLHQGVVIWIDPGLERICARLQSDPGERPLLNGSDPLLSIRKLFNERQKFYVEADLHLKVFDQKPDEVARKILQGVHSIIQDQEDPDALQTTAK